MGNRKSNTSVSFLMELIIVIFFFTIASAICVLILGNAKEKNQYAYDLRNAIMFGENIIAEKDETKVTEALQNKELYLDQEGNFVSKEDAYYDISVEQKEEVNQAGYALCDMIISHDGEKLTTLSFLLKGGVSS